MGSMGKQKAKPRSRERSPNNRTTTAFQISDDLWAVLQPLLPVPVNTPSDAQRDCIAEQKKGN